MKKINRTRNSESGSIIIISLLIISTILGFVVFSIDLSNNFLAYTKTERINDISALSGAVLIKEGLTPDKAEEASRSIALVNYKMNRGVSWRGQDNDVDPHAMEFANNRYQMSVSRTRPYVGWFSGIFSNNNIKENQQQSIAAIDTGEPDKTKPLHLILMTDMNTYIYYDETQLYIQPKELGDEFAEEILNQLSDADYFTWITYTSVAKVVFNKIHPTLLNKELIESEFIKLKERNVVDSSADIHYASFQNFEAEPATAFIAARAILAETPAEEREALVLVSDAVINDHESFIHFEFQYFPDHTFDESWYAFNEEEAARLRDVCDVRYLTFWDTRKRYAEEYDIYIRNTHVEPGLGEEFTGTIIKNLQLNRDMRVYTVSTKQLSPDQGEGKYNFENSGFSHNYQIDIADDPGVAFSEVPNRLKCSPGRPIEKQGMYFPYNQDWGSTAKKLAHHARYSPYIEENSRYFSKPTLISGL